MRNSFGLSKGGKTWLAQNIYKDYATWFAERDVLPIIKSSASILSAFIDRSTECKNKVRTTRAKTRYSKIAADVVADIDQQAWGEEDQCRKE